jgi:F0F1-type ATP synthase assembly protein I
MLLAIPSCLGRTVDGFFLGRWLERFATDPWFMIAGVILGFVAAGRETFLIIRRVEAEEERDKRP